MKYCIVHSKKRGTWHLRWWENGRRQSKQIGDVRQLPTLEAAKKAAAPHIRLLDKPTVPFVKDLVEEFKAQKEYEELHFSTRRGYESWFTNHIIPKWGESLLTDLKARPVKLWLQGLEGQTPKGEPKSLTPKSLVHIKALIGQLWDFAALCEYVSASDRNPMELVTIKGASKRQRIPASLTEDQFQKFAGELAEPVRTIALVCVSFGLRISECLGLKWSDVDWINGRLSVSRGIVRQHTGDLKTEGSRRTMGVNPEFLPVFAEWRKKSQFTEDQDWVFASPVKLGRLPVSYPYVLQSFQAAALRAGIGPVSTHSMRHTFRSWLDACGTSIAVQQKMMRHADIRTTMNTYGNVVTNEMDVAHSKVVQMALRA